jgi:hypothetical protein
MNFPSETKFTRRVAAAIAAGAVAASTLLPSGALAVQNTPVDQQSQPVSLPSCSDKSWASPTVIIHTQLFPGSSSDRAAMDAAVRDVNAQLALVGGSSVHIADARDTADAFHETPYNNASPTIHIGFLNLLPPDLAVTNLAFSCEHYITIDRDTAWDYGTPEDSITDGQRYYEAGKLDPSGHVFFRISYQHELLHALGVGAFDPDGHPDDQYTFLNYGDRPWVNVAPSAMIRPLPWDVGQLRKLYPGIGSRIDVAALNTWIDRADFSGSGDVLTQKLLCAPSVGRSANDDKMFAANCGDKNATSICPGDTVQVRYVAANYSTEPMTVNANFWFSNDDEWQQSDLESLSAQGYWMNPANAVEQPANVMVPSLPSVGTSRYHLIVRLTSETTSGVVVHDSIPLRGVLVRGAACGGLSTSMDSSSTNVNSSTVFGR